MAGLTVAEGPAEGAAHGGGNLRQLAHLAVEVITWLLAFHAKSSPRKIALP